MENNNYTTKFYLLTLVLLTAIFTSQVNAQQGSVEFSQLRNNQIIEEGEALQIEALINNADSAVTRVELSLNGTLIRAERRSPYIWGDQAGRDTEISNLPTGRHTLSLVAIASDGSRHTSDIRVNVVADQTVDFEFSSPAQGQQFDAGDRLVVELNVNGSNDLVRNFSLTYDGDFVRVERFAPYQWGVEGQAERSGLFAKLAAGNHTITVVATLNNGETRTITREISVQGNNNNDGSELPQISLAIEQRVAFEKSEEPASYIVSRTGSNTPLSVSFDLSTDGVNVTESQYDFVYGDTGRPVRNSLNFLQGQTERVIEIRPVADEQFETVQGLTLTLQEGDNYTVDTPEGFRTIILDARNIAANDQNFIGIFRPIDGVSTTASGVLSLVIRGDNRVATLNYSFDNLSSGQQDQFLEVAPSGVTFTDLPRGNTVTDFPINIRPGGIFRTSQEVLDALIDGSFFVRILSDEFPEGEIAAIIQRAGDISGPEIPEENLTVQQVDIDIIRFLNQATFGATEETYNELRRQIRDNGSNRLAVYEDWIDSQLDTRRTMTSMTNLMIAITDNDRIGTATRFERVRGFWTMAVNSPDQLRHRWAQSLSEILVISDDVNPILNAYRGLTSYWDMLASSGTGTYEDLLGQVTRHTSMGEYLSHLQNQKADPELGIFPDENYAREIMQLFSFGLVQLNQDGSFILGDNNAPIPTYDNDTISEIARIFTGLSHSRIAVREDINRDNVNNRFDTDTRNSGGNQAQWTHPMRFFPEFHDFGRKELFTDQGQQVIIGARNETIGAADRELDEVMSALVAHSSTAPRMSRLLIQQLVTSNPSGAYIERVANAFGEDGDMRATIKAILLDQEARNPNVIEVGAFGKQKSPLLQLTSFMRLTDMSSEFFLDGRNNDMNFSNFINLDAYGEDATFLRVGSFSTNHVNLAAPSVFNFYSPDYSPPGELANRSLVAPEMELLTESSLFDTINDIFLLIRNGTLRNGSVDDFSISRDRQTVRINRDRLTAIFDDAPGSDRDKAAALVDYLDFYYNASQIALTNDISGTRDFIIDAVANSRDDDRLDLALYGIANAPESLVQK